MSTTCQGSPSRVFDARVLRTHLTTLIIATIALLGGCSTNQPTPPPALTDEQAQQLSLARFNTFQLGTVSLTSTFTMNNAAVTLTGWVDYRAEVAYAVSIENGAPQNLLMWDHTTVALKQVDGTVQTPPLPQPELDGGWGTGRINTATSELQQILIVVLEFGDDRPDNPLLVRQGGARLLRTEQVEGAPMNVYSVPPTPSHSTGGVTGTSPGPGPTADERAINYWIDDAGTIRRAEFTLASGAAVTVTLAAADGPELRNPFTDNGSR